MAKKKSTARKPVKKKAAQRPAAKKAASKKPPGKKSAAKKTASSTPTKKAPKPKADRKGSAKKPKRKKLGRPRLPGDARLDQIFQKDYEARQICEFLGVQTLKDLERYEPEEIIRRLTSPVIQTVGRMRKVLAIANRSLAGDEEFAIEFRERYAPK